MCTVFTNKQTKPPTRNPQNGINRPRVICPNETVGAVPMCPPERPRSGVSIPRYICASRIMHEDLTMDALLWGDTGGHTGTAPTNLHQTMRCAITASRCTFDNPRQPRGVSIPHRGYTFDSAGLASATQPTLGNSASEEATPLGVVLFPPHCFLISSHTHTSGAEMHRALPPPFFKSCVCKLASRWMPFCFKASYSLGVTVASP